MAILVSQLENQKKILKEISANIFYLILGAILLIPFILFVLVIQSPIYLYRLLVIKILAPCFRQKIGKAVTVNAQFQATEFLKNYEIRAPKFVIIVNIVLKGTLTLEEVRQLILTKWIHAKAADGNLYYPEFQQYVERWMGFMFWKQTETFDLNNHIIFHELDKNGLEEESKGFLGRLQEELLSKPFVAQRSPWEVHLIQNYKTAEKKDEKLTALVFRFHHAIADGFAVSHAIIQGLCGTTLEEAGMQIPKKSVENKRLTFLSWICSTLVTPLQFLQDLGFIISMVWRRQHPWKKQKTIQVDIETQKLNEASSSAKDICVRSPVIPVQKLKIIKNKFGVSLSSVLFSSLSASLAKNFSEGVPRIRQNSVRVTTMIPTTGHDNKLRNHTYGTIFEIDTRQRIKSHKRLVEMEKRLLNSKNSFVPRLMFTLVKIVSASLANPFAKMINSCTCVPVCTSIFRSPEKQFSIDDKKVVLSLDVVCGSFSDVMAVMCSYNDNLTLALTSRDNLLDKCQLEEMIRHFSEEIEILYEMANEKI